MLVSDAYIIITMAFAAFMACIWIPFKMNEYQLPIYFRESNSNIWLDFLLLRIIAFFAFVSLSGCLPHFVFYNVNQWNKCLHTSHPDWIDITWTDQY
jgi:hypothetical protein